MLILSLIYYTCTFVWFNLKIEQNSFKNLLLDYFNNILILTIVPIIFIMKNTQMHIANTSSIFLLKLTNKVNIFKITSVQSYIFCSNTNHNWGSTWGLQKNNLPVVFPFCEPLCSSYTCMNKLTDNKGVF